MPWKPGPKKPAAGVVSAALDDLRRSRDFYESQEEGLGDYFFTSLSEDLDSLELHGGIHRKVFGYHRMLAARFPYGIYYLKRTDEIVVFRILSLRQDPKGIRRALRQ